MLRPDGGAHLRRGLHGHLRCQLARVPEPNPNPNPNTNPNPNPDPDPEPNPNPNPNPNQESDNHFHYMDNRVLPEFVDAERATAEGW